MPKPPPLPPNIKILLSGSDEDLVCRSAVCTLLGITTMRLHEMICQEGFPSPQQIDRRSWWTTGSLRVWWRATGGVSREGEIPNVSNI